MRMTIMNNPYFLRWLCLLLAASNLVLVVSLVVLGSRVGACGH